MHLAELPHSVIINCIWGSVGGWVGGGCLVLALVPWSNLTPTEKGKPCAIFAPNTQRTKQIHTCTMFIHMHESGPSHLGQSLCTHVI